jgi:tyrosyl-tRNA synthetase
MNIQEVLERGVERVYPSKEALSKALESGKKLTFYCGFDPSAASLHIGNAIQLAKLAQLQALGHKVIFLVGDFTGMIGDPTDKKAARQELDRATVKANSKVWKKQVSAWLSFSGTNAAEIKYNSKWYDKMSVENFVRLGSHFTVQQMIVRDMFQERLKQEKPIYVSEFLYPLIQGYDCVAMEVDGEVGGNDQTFNMLSGRDLMKSMTGKEKFVISGKLLVDSEGKKMGKSEGNVVNLDESPENMYGKVMSWPDSILSVAFELCTKLSWDEVKKVQERLSNTTLNPRDFKMKLAHEITKVYHGQKKADAAEAHFVKTIQKKEAPDEIKEVTVKNLNIIEALVESGLASSKSEARRLLEQGGIKVDGQVVSDANYTLSVPSVLQKGKREYRKIVK